MMKRRPLILAAATLCLLLGASASASAKDTWTSVRSRNFFLIGNASERDIRQVATRLEQFREVFTKLLPTVKFNSPVPTTVVVFKSDSSYKPFKPVVDGKVSEVAGYFQSGEDVNYITLTTEKRSENPYRTIYHEYVHLLVDNNLGRSNVPPWFNEGLAEYYSTFDIDDDRKIYLGNLIDNHLYLLRQQQMLPLQQLFSVDYYSLHRNRRDTRWVFYAQSWALVHYLILGNEGKRLPQMGQFFDLFLKKTPMERAFREAFQTDFAGMEKELKDYVGRNSFRAQVATFKNKLEFDREMQSAPVSDAEAEAYLGDLLLHTNRLDDAAARLEQALALDPKSGMAHASLGMVRMRQRRFAEAKQHLRQAVAANQQNHLAHHYYAYTLSREGMNEVGWVSGYPAETAREMRAALRKAIELKPDFPESYHLLAWINLVTDEQLEESIQLIKRALALAPGSQEYAFVLAQIYMRQENFDAARQVVEPLAQSSSEPHIRSGAQSILKAVNSMQEQMARVRAGRDAGPDEGPPPRLRRREDSDDKRTETQAGDIEEPSVALDDISSVIREALRKPQDGETRVRGLLTRIDCSAKGLVFQIKVGDRLLKLHSVNFEVIHMMAFTPDANGEITCGARKPENAVVVTYRPPAYARSKVDGQMVSMEFVPASFELK